MSGMIELIRKSAVSASLMQAAARGALMVKPDEMIEILVYLATHNKVFGAQARMTLAGWDEKSSIATASNPNTSQEVLRYMAADENLRSSLLPALLENPSVPEDSLVKLAKAASRDAVKLMATSARVNASQAIRSALAANPNFVPVISATAPSPQKSDAEPELPASVPTTPLAPEPNEGETSAQVEQAAAGDGDVDQHIATFMAEHAVEIAAEADKPFQPLGGLEIIEPASLSPEQPVVAQSAAVAAQPTGSPAAAATHAVKSYHPRMEEASKRDSTLQKIGKLDIKGRIQLAMKGSKEERSILI